MSVATLRTKAALPLANGTDEREQGPSLNLVTYSLALATVTAPWLCCTLDEAEEFTGDTGEELDSDELAPDVYHALANWLAMHKGLETPAPDSVRELREDELLDYGIERADIGDNAVWLATWPDRAGWYEEDTHTQKPEFRFCAVVCNESEAAESREAIHAWLWARVEVTS